jgi:hypothetical protein
MNTKSNDVKREKEVLTTEKLRQFEGFEHYTDEEAEELLETYHLFAEIAYNSFRKLNK